MIPLPRFRFKLLAIRRERLALQQHLRRTTDRLQGLLVRLENLESAVAQGPGQRRAEEKSAKKGPKRNDAVGAGRERPHHA